MKNKVNSGVLFKNENKKSDRHPDYNGSITLQDGDYWLSSWINESQNGKKYMSLSIGDKKEDLQKEEITVENDLDSDVPF